MRAPFMTGQMVRPSALDGYPRCLKTTAGPWDVHTTSTSPSSSSPMSPTTSPRDAGRPCVVCLEEASGMYFGALVCLPCKSFFIRSTKDGLPRFTCLINATCDVTHGNRLRCQYCRFQKCLRVGMCRKEKPEIVQPAEGQVLCRVCHDIANGVHFGVPTCEGCKKFFRRALKESNSYFCKFEKTCAMNPRNRNSCRYCRYNRCIHVGMSRTAIRMGRPKKMSVKDFRQRPDVNPYKLCGMRDPARRHHSFSSSSSSSPTSCSSPSSSSSSASMPSPPICSSNPSFSPHFPASSSSASVIKALGRQAECPDPNLARYNQAQSVIRSCGNPNALPTSMGVDTRPTGALEATPRPLPGGEYRQTVLAHGARRPLPSLPHTASYSPPESSYHGCDNQSLASSSSGYYSSRSVSASSHSPSSSDLSSFDPIDSPDDSLEDDDDVDQDDVGSCRELVDIEDHLADILSTLSQYNAPGGGGVLETLVAAPPANHHHEQFAVAVKPETADFTNSSCQYGGSRSPTASQMPPARFAHVDPEGANVVKREAEVIVGSPTSSKLSAAGSGERDSWATPQSSLFSQMYNSLLLTYNMGEGLTDDTRYGNPHSDQQRQAQQGMHYPHVTNNNLTPLYI